MKIFLNMESSPHALPLNIITLKQLPRLPMGQTPSAHFPGSGSGSAALPGAASAWPCWIPAAFPTKITKAGSRPFSIWCAAAGFPTMTTATAPMSVASSAETAVPAAAASRCCARLPPDPGQGSGQTGRRLCLGCAFRTSHRPAAAGPLQYPRRQRLRRFLLRPEP